MTQTSFSFSRNGNEATNSSNSIKINKTNKDAEKEKKGKVIFIDLHDVCVHLDTKNAVKKSQIIFEKGILEGVKTIGAWISFGCFLGYKRATRKPDEGKSIEGYLRNYSIHYPQWGNLVMESYKEIGNTQKIDPSMFKILKVAKAHQVKIVLTSNIGPDALKAAKKRSELEPLFELVDDYACAFYQDSEEKKLISKPDSHFFSYIKNLESYKNAKDSIFIDDSSDNCKAAKKSGIFSSVLQFSGKENDFLTIEEFIFQ